MPSIDQNPLPCLTSIAKRCPGLEEQSSEEPAWRARPSPRGASRRGGTGNGVQFCHQPSRRNGPTTRYFRYMVDRRFQENGIEHRLTKPNHPWSDEDQKTVWETVFLRNGQVERMNRTLKDATVKRYHDETQEQLKPHLQLFLDAYNHAKRLKTPKGLTPYEFIGKTWTEEPERFISDPTNHISGLNTLSFGAVW